MECDAGAWIRAFVPHIEKLMHDSQSMYFQADIAL
jgi:hypothetical protein